MKLQVKFSNRFKNDLKLAKKQNKSLEKLFIVIEKLANGEVLGNGATPKTVARARAPKLMCDNPSPIIEYLFNTRTTPKTAAQTDIIIPTTNARVINPYEKIVSIKSIIYFSPTNCPLQQLSCNLCKFRKIAPYAYRCEAHFLCRLLQHLCHALSL